MIPEYVALVCLGLLTLGTGTAALGMAIHAVRLYRMDRRLAPPRRRILGTMEVGK